MKTRNWIILFGGVISVCLAVLLFLKSISVEEPVAVIYQDGKVIDRIDLAAEEPYEYVITGEDGGYNILFIKNGQVSVSKASCPDQICVRHGSISDGSEPIICLPNKVIVQIEKSDDQPADGYTRG